MNQEDKNTVREALDWSVSEVDRLWSMICRHRLSEQTHGPNDSGDYTRAKEAIALLSREEHPRTFTQEEVAEKDRRIAELEKALQWVVRNGTMAHGNNIVVVAQEALNTKSHG